MDAPSPAPLSLGHHVGQALKMVRLEKGLTLEQMAEETRVRRAYLAAIEDFALDVLPSRPFTIGYVKAYANALGLDGEAAVDRFRRDDPVREQGLRAPVGVAGDGDPRLAAIVFGGTLIFGAIILWNIAQRTISQQAPPKIETVQGDVLPTTISGPVKLGAPLPAPTESTTPPPYETPGMAAAMAEVGNLDNSDSSRNPAILPNTFEPEGQVYGEAGSSVMLQARKSASLVIRRPDGSALFARQLSVGEAYGAPLGIGLKVELVEGDVVQIFVNGISHGLLPKGQSAIATLAATPQ